MYTIGRRMKQHHLVPELSGYVQDDTRGARVLWNNPNRPRRQLTNGQQVVAKNGAPGIVTASGNDHQIGGNRRSADVSRGGPDLSDDCASGQEGCDPDRNTVPHHRAGHVKLSVGVSEALGSRE